MTQVRHYSTGEGGVLAYDARYATRTPSGIGQVCLEVLRGMARLPDCPPLHVLVNDATRLPDEVWGHPGFTFCPVPWSPYSLANQIRLPRWLRERRVRLLHSVDCHNPLWPFGGRLVVNIHDLIPLTCGARFSRSLKARYPLAWWSWVTLQCSRAARVICPSRHAAADIQRLLGLDPARVVVVENPIREWEAIESPAVLRHRWKIDGRVISYVGRQEPYKNVVALVRALPLLNASLGGERLRLVVAGNLDRRYPEARQEVERLGLREQVLFPGYLDEAALGGLYRMSEVFVFPSLYEGFGMPPLEAMRFGIPVVAGRLTALPEVLGSAALYVDTQDPAALARGIRDVLCEPLLAQQLRQAGLRQVARFGSERAARGYVQAYQEVLAEGAPRRGVGYVLPAYGRAGTLAGLSGESRDVQPAGQS